MKIKILAATAALSALVACGDNETPATNDMAMNGMMANDMAMNDMAAENVMMNGSAAAPANGQDYAAMAAASDMFEIESSKLAQEKAQNADVKAFAQMLVTEHQKSTADLKTAAGQAQPAVTVTPQMNAEQAANLEALRAASGAEFDRLYLQQQVPAHEKALAMLQGYAASGDVPSLKQHASMTTGPVEKHLARARELMVSMGQ